MVRIHRITCLWVTLLYLVSLVLMVSINYSVADFRRNEVSHDQVILVTGFEPFSGNRVNSSWEAVRRLDGLQVLGRRVVTLQLPVVWDQASGQLQDAIDRYQPELVINVGQAGTRFELDSRAQNVAGHITDNRGATPRSPLISPTGPSVFDTSVNLRDIANALKQANIPAIISPSAGTYLCNFVSYHSYQYLAQVDPDAATLFVHVPAVSSLDGVADRQTVSQIVDALHIILLTAAAKI